MAPTGTTRITLDLTQSEYNDVWGWVNYYRAHPQYVGVPTGDWNNGAPTYQSAIVLSDTTKARFDQLSAQFPGGGEVPVPPTGEFADLKLRRRVGSWAAFQPQFFVESNALKAAYPQLTNTIAQLNGYYGPGGYGNISGVRRGDAFLFHNFKTGMLERDVAGAADAFILANSVSEDYPNGVPPPSIEIP